MDAATETTVRIPAELAAELADLAAAMRREVPELIARALREYLHRERELVAAVLVGVRDAQAGRFVPHEQIEAWLDSLDTDPEQVPVAAP